ncbi:hypothetical protein [Photobacterium leiognathi]|uniref:hypothetical protein n=1 Tax=Photobacterium leiognathi TaxID=553611 RepID=UPI002981032A|nr:hypothetical protein [Photobacterium leiognathi]
MRLKVVTISLVSLLLMGCGDKTKPQKSDIPLFEAFLASNPISEVSSEIAIDSIYKPGDALFNAVWGVQRRRWDIAEKELKPWVEKNDPEAMFWMASIIYGSSILDTPKAKLLFMESAKLGNPYAALFFSPKNNQCQLYYSDVCSEEWVSKAQTLFAEQAKKGDVRGIYYSKVLNNPTHEEYVQAVIEAAENHYYYPLVEYANKTARKHEPNKDMEKMAIKLLQYARYHNFVPAIEALGNYEAKNNRANGREIKSLDKQGLMLGSNIAWTQYRIDALENETLSNEQKYIIAKATDIFNGDSFALGYIDAPKNEQELIEANEKAQQRVDEVKKVIYIDGAHVPLY